MSDVRVQKFLSRAGIASRREAESMMKAGRVSVNGTIVSTPGAKIDPGRDRVQVDGKDVAIPSPRWILLHKPPGYITTRRDVRGRRTVYDLLPEGSGGLRYVGRLDRGTEGVLIMTNQGDTANALLHPSSEIEREYRAKVEGRPSGRALQTLEAGIELEDGLARAESVQLLNWDSKRSVVQLVLREGRNHEVRRMMEAIEHPVVRLTRVRFGPIKLGPLGRGNWRELTAEEIRMLEAAANRGRGGSTGAVKGDGAPGRAPVGRGRGRATKKGRSRQRRNL